MGPQAVPGGEHVGLAGAQPPVHVNAPFVEGDARLLQAQVLDIGTASYRDPQYFAH